MLSNHQATEEEKTKICDWKYEGEYALYNTVSYEEMIWFLAFLTELK